MGILSGAAGVSVLLFGLFAGAWADRLRRRPILIWTDLAPRGRCSSRSHRGDAAFADDDASVRRGGRRRDCSRFCSTRRYQAYVPSLVQRENLVQANAKLALSESVAEVSGPGHRGVPGDGADGAGRDPVRRAVVPGLGCVDRAGSQAGARPADAPRDSHIGRRFAEGLRFSWRNPYLRPMGLRSRDGRAVHGLLCEPVSAVHREGAGPVAGGHRRGGGVGRGVRARRGAALGDGRAAIGLRPGVPVRRAVHQFHDVPAPAGARVGGAGLRFPDCRADGGFRVADDQHHGDELAAGVGAAANSGPRELGDEPAVQRNHSDRARSRAARWQR